MGDGREDYSDNEDDEEENELPQIPLNLAGPQEVNVDNSQVKIGNTVNVNFSVENIVVKSENLDQLLQGCSTQLPGLLTNLLIYKPSETSKLLNKSSGDVFQLPITYGDHHSTASSNVQNVALISCSSNDDTRSPNSVKVDSDEEVKKSLVTTHVKNNELEDTAFNVTRNDNTKMIIPGNDIPLNNICCSKEDSELCNSLGFTKHFDEDEVTGDSLINEFVKNLNDFLNFTHNEIDVPSLSGDIDMNMLEMNLDTGKVKGLFPVIREEGIELDLKDNLFVISIPLKLENLQLTFERVSMGWHGITLRSTLKVTVVKNSILIHLSYGTNDNGYSENDVSVEINLERLEIDFDSNFVANEILVKIAKKSIKKLFQRKFSDELRNYYTNSIKCVLECNDICAKLASIYM